MQQTSDAGDHYNSGKVLPDGESAASGVSWGAILAGAFITAALSLSMLALGAGFGLLSVSPWPHAAVPVSVVTTAAIIWLIVIQIVASGAGGYVAGRLRTKWAAIHRDEIYFRDTAHGLLVWAVAVVISAGFLTSATSAMVGGAMATPEGSSLATRYFVDALFRSTPSTTANSRGAPVANPESDAVRREAAIILTKALSQPDMDGQDRSYLAQLVRANTELSQNDAVQRVSDVIRRAQESADQARKAGARLLLWIFLALLIGAFCGSYAAMIGGRQRDQVKTV